MKLSTIHLLLTHQCLSECDHCYVWGGPRQRGVMSLATVRKTLDQARDMETVERVYFEGGEPFLYYPLMLRGVRIAAMLGYEVGLLTNGFWATSLKDALEWLMPLSGLVHDLSVSCDAYHNDSGAAPEVEYARAAAARLSIPFTVTKVAGPEETSAMLLTGQILADTRSLVYRGRAAARLANRSAQQLWSQFSQCECEDLRHIRRLFIDPFENVHICQGIVIGNLGRLRLETICDDYKTLQHPLLGPLLEGGPAELARCHAVSLPQEYYADACHLCYTVRASLRAKFPEILGPDAMYGAV